jgi:hypothetical protein
MQTLWRLGTKKIGKIHLEQQEEDRDAAENRRALPCEMGRLWYALSNSPSAKEMCPPEFLRANLPSNSNSYRIRHHRLSLGLRFTVCEEKPLSLLLTSK